MLASAGISPAQAWMPASSAGMTGGNCERERLPRQCQQLLVQALRNLHTFAAGAVARLEAAEAGQPCARLFQERRQEVFQPIGRASGRERVCPYVLNSAVDVSFKKKKKEKN